VTAPDGVGGRGGRPDAAPPDPRAAPARTALLRRGAVLGLVAGFLSGLFGVGGGILIVPVLVLALHLDQRLAHGTSLSAVIPIAVSGVVGFALDDSIDWTVALLLVVGAVGGAVIGTHALRLLSPRVLGLAFATLLVVTAVRLVVDNSDAGGRADLDATHAAAYVLLGAVSGTLAGMLGVGGGIVLVPAMVVLFSIPAAVAKGTSLVVIIPTGVVGTLRNVRRGHADLGVAASVGLAGVVSAFAASKLSVGLDEQVSNRLFAVLLVAVATRMFAAAWRQREQRAQQSADAEAHGSR
jgi:uncharacterized membrane protein YfcA